MWTIIENTIVTIDKIKATIKLTIETAHHQILQTIGIKLKIVGIGAKIVVNQTHIKKNQTILQIQTEVLWAECIFAIVSSLVHT